MSTEANEAKIEEKVARLLQWAFGNGQPGLEARLITYIDKRDTHKENNARQDLRDLEAKYDKLEIKQNIRHEANSEILNKIKGAVILGSWGIATLIAIAVLIVGMLTYLGSHRSG